MIIQKELSILLLIDCNLLAKVYINLIDQKEPTFDLGNKDIISGNFKKDNVVYFKEVVQPTEQEIKNHNEFLKKNLKKNFFN